MIVKIKLPQATAAAWHWELRSCNHWLASLHDSQRTTHYLSQRVDSTGVCCCYSVVSVPLVVQQDHPMGWPLPRR
jgi:hypothetical protein